MYAIIGANGKVGRATAAVLRDQGKSVRAIVRDAAAAQPLAELGCELVEADINDQTALDRALAGATAVQVICPVDPRAEPAVELFSRMIDRLATALASARPERVLVISDYGAHLPIDTGITSTFYEMEQKLGGLPGRVTFLRSAEQMQNFARVARNAIESGQFPSLHHPLEKIFPTVSAFDVGRVSAELLLEPDPPRVVHVEGPRRYRPLDVAAMLGEITGRDVTAVELPRERWRDVLIGAGISPSYTELVVRLNDVHNNGLIDVEPGSNEVRRGTTDLREVLETMVAAART